MSNKINKNIKILIVDDDSMVTEVLLEYLLSFGMKNVKKETNPHRALKLMQDPKFEVDLVLSDWDMPGVSGLDLLKAIRKSPIRKQLKFIMVTSQKSMERFKITQAAHWGVSSYIVKPFRSEVLKQKIWEVMNWPQEKNEAA